MSDYAMQAEAEMWDAIAAQDYDRAAREAELADDVMPCGCCSGSCYCDGETPAAAELCSRCGRVQPAPWSPCPRCTSSG